MSMVDDKDYCVNCGQLLQPGQVGVCSEECYDERTHCGIDLVEHCWHCDRRLPGLHWGFCSDSCEIAFHRQRSGLESGDPE